MEALGVVQFVNKCSTMRHELTFTGRIRGIKGQRFEKTLEKAETSGILKTEDIL